MDEIEDNVGDSTLKRLWVAGHTFAEKTVEKIYDEIVLLRLQNDKIHTKVSLIEGITHAWATMFKSGQDNVEKVYPSKRK